MICRTTLFIVTLLLTAGPGALAAQDAFGAAVAIPGPDEVVILKPGAARGPSQAHVFRRTGGEWVRTQALVMAPGGLPGESLTPALTRSASGNALLLGAGDPSGAVVGHLYLREATGWREYGRVPMDPAAEPAPGLAGGGLDMGTLMALMEPSLRPAALSPDGTRLAVAGGVLGNGRVRFLRRTGSQWRVEGEFSDPGSEGAISGLAWDGSRVLVGAPRSGTGAGAVLLAADGPAPDVEARFDALPPAGAGPDGGGSGPPGAAVALAGEDVFLGDPMQDRVRWYRRSARGEWTLAGVLTPGSEVAIPAGGDAPRGPVGRITGFGEVLAATSGHLVVGAPRGRSNATGWTWSPSCPSPPWAQSRGSR